MLRLDATELTKRSGFSEAGDRLTDILETNGYDSRTARPLQSIGEFGDEYMFNTILTTIIDRHLGPAVAPAELHRNAGVGGSPTGVQHPALEDDALLDFLTGISVDVPEQDILMIAEEIAAEFAMCSSPKR